jgi:hypothetical protein
MKGEPLRVKYRGRQPLLRVLRGLISRQHRRGVSDFERYPVTEPGVEKKFLPGTTLALAAGGRVKDGGAQVLGLLRTAGLRSFVMNHTTHHRERFTAYLRTQGTPFPSSYGRTADTEG